MLKAKVNRILITPIISIYDGEDLVQEKVGKSSTILVYNLCELPPKLKELENQVNAKQAEVEATGEKRLTEDSKDSPKLQLSTSGKVDKRRSNRE